MTRKLGFQMLQFALDLLVALRLTSLTLKGSNATLDFAHQIGHSKQILFSMIQFAQGFLFLHLELGDPGSFFENDSSVFRLTAQELGDVPLSHDAVAGPPDAGPHEQLLNIPQSTTHIIDVVLTPSITHHPSLDGDFTVGEVDPCRLELFLIDISQGEGNFRNAMRLPPIGAIENNVCHFATTQRLGRLLTQYPTDRISDIGLPTSVGTHDRRDTGFKVQGSLVRKRFEPHYR